MKTQLSENLPKFVDRFSLKSLFLQPKFLGHNLSSATGFVVSHRCTDFLITNWHVVTGRNAITNEPLASSCAIPDSLTVFFHSSSSIYHFVEVDLPLYRDEQPLWIEHPAGARVDVVAIPLATREDLSINPYDLHADSGLIIKPGMPICIIGYPLGLRTCDYWPIWKTGHLASDRELDYEGKKVFLVDVTSKPGMSGSPVIVRATGGSRRSGGTVIGGHPVNDFLGIYSGRIHDLADVGIVWKPQVLFELLSGPMLGDVPVSS